MLEYLSILGLFATVGNYLEFSIASKVGFYKWKFWNFRGTVQYERDHVESFLENFSSWNILIWYFGEIELCRYRPGDIWWFNWEPIRRKLENNTHLSINSITDYNLLYFPPSNFSVLTTKLFVNIFSDVKISPSPRERKLLIFFFFVRAN